MIRINKPKATRGQFDKHRILTAILLALQNVHTDANISPTLESDIDDDMRSPIIYHADDIPKDGTIEKYFEISTEYQSDHFCARILVNSNIEFYKYKRQHELINWLKSEDIKLDRNPLQATLKPHQVGFFTHFVARTDQTTLYENHIQTAVSTSCPSLFLQTKYIKVNNVMFRVWNVYFDKQDIEEITIELKSAFNTEDIRQFFP
jgi:hypothetical protein